MKAKAMNAIQMTHHGIRPTEGFASNAELVKPGTNGPTAKCFNTNLASLLGRLGEARATPSSPWCGDDEARGIVEQLNRDAGYEPVGHGDLDKAAAQEAMVGLIFGIAQSGLGEFVYRMAPLEQL